MGRGNLDRARYLLGGIYGRAIVAGNQMHLTVGAVLLVTRAANADVAHPGYWGSPFSTS